MDSLHDKGFLVLRNVLTDKDVAAALSCLDDRTMDYMQMRKFIKEIMLPSFSADIQFKKYRVSNNNNSVDAGAFHRDITPIRANTENLPVFTCLCYLNTTIMELIPGSHKNITMTYAEAISAYSSKIQLTLNPNDILIFYSSIIHRGIFTENLKQRYLIQVFNCFLNKSDYDKYAHLIVSVPGDDAYSIIPYYLFKNSITEYIPNMFGYLNAATGGGVTDSDKLYNCPQDLQKYVYFSSEGLCKRVTVEPGKMQKLNLYDNVVPSTDLSLECIPGFKYSRYTKQYYMYTAILILLLLIITFVIYYIFTRLFFIRYVAKIVKRARKKYF